MKIFLSFVLLISLIPMAVSAPKGEASEPDKEQAAAASGQDKESQAVVSGDEVDADEEQDGTAAEKTDDESAGNGDQASGKQEVPDFNAGLAEMVGEIMEKDEFDIPAEEKEEIDDEGEYASKHAGSEAAEKAD